MNHPRLRLSPAVSPSDAAGRLSDLIKAAGNVAGQAGGATSVERLTRLRDNYLLWAENAWSQLEGLTFDPAVTSALLTPGSWHIRTLHDDPRPFALVDREIRQHVVFLQALLDDLQTRAARIPDDTGHVVVLDSNVLLHFQPPANVPWRALVGSGEINLVLPLRVIEELDAKKAARRVDLAQRARTILTQVRAQTGPAGQPGAIGDGITLQVLLESRGRIRPPDADEEILDVCLELMAFSPNPVTLVTGDTSMQMRAEALGIAVLDMPEKYLRVPTT